MTGVHATASQHTEPRVTRSRGLWPREHGAYAELAFPLLTGFLFSGFSVAGIGFATAVTSWFLANEPLTVLKGQRGRLAQDALAEAARRRLLFLGSVGAIGAAVAMLLAPPAARIAAVVPAACAGFLAPTMFWGKPKALGAEVLMAAAFASMLPPVAIAGGGDPSRAAVAAGAWLACFSLATIAVHAVKARVKPGLAPPWTVRGSPVLALFVTAVAAFVVLATPERAGAGLSVLPASAVTLGADVLRVHPRHLKRVGWSLVAGHVVTLLLLLRQ
jgi:hypothetical protein